jgi:hypothetical protein
MFVVRRFLVSPAFARLVARQSSEPQDRVVTKETGYWTWCRAFRPEKRHDGGGGPSRKASLTMGSHGRRGREGSKHGRCESPEKP